MDPITFTGADEEEPFRSNLAILEMHYGTSVPGACEWHLSNWGGHFLEWVLAQSSAVRQVFRCTRLFTRRKANQSGRPKWRQAWTFYGLKTTRCCPMPPSTGETLTVATSYATQTPASGEPRPSGRPGKLLTRLTQLLGGLRS